MSLPSFEFARFPQKKGIAIVACSAFAPEHAVFERGVAQLQTMGFDVHNYYDAGQKFQRFGASDKERAAQIHAAIRNPNVDFIMPLRGGYGMSRILPMSDLAETAASKKVLIGHSDFTPLQMALLAQYGMPTLAGPMVCDDFGREDLSDFTLSQFLAVLSGNEHSLEWQSENNPEVAVDAVLWGGNLAMLTHIVGTPYMPKIENGILFVEDIGEHPFRIERMLLQLHFAGVLAKQKAIVLGNFSGYKLSERDNGYNLDEMVKYIRSIVNVPMLTGLPFGHTKDKTTLVNGSHASLKCAGGATQLTMRY
jgi:muramoyltetrapeptide carboxypeptidase